MRVVNSKMVEEMRHLYWDYKLSLRETSCVIGVSDTTISHYLKIKGYGVRTVSQAQTGKCEEESRGWKGENAGYVAKHMWIKKHYGKANKCEKCGTKNTSRYEWANISGEYKRERSDYMQLCPSCHRKFDLRKPYCKHGHLYTPETTYIDSRGFRQCRICREMATRRRRYSEKHAKANKVSRMG